MIEPGTTVWVIGLNYGDRYSYAQEVVTESHSHIDGKNIVHEYRLHSVSNRYFKESELFLTELDVACQAAANLNATINELREKRDALEAKMLELGRKP
jgi:hypothetical protein